MGHTWLQLLNHLHLCKGNAKWSRFMLALQNGITNKRLGNRCNQKLWVWAKEVPALLTSNKTKRQGAVILKTGMPEEGLSLNLSYNILLTIKAHILKYSSYLPPTKREKGFFGQQKLFVQLENRIIIYFNGKPQKLTCSKTHLSKSVSPVKIPFKRRQI